MSARANSMETLLRWIPFVLCAPIFSTVILRASIHSLIVGAAKNAIGTDLCQSSWRIERKEIRNLTMPDSSPIRVGDAVRHLDTGEVGIVVWQWDFDGETVDNYVAFFGDSFPSAKPDGKPYALRYYTTSLEKIARPNQGEQGGGSKGD
jgi:hypothetical protein